MSTQSATGASVACSIAPMLSVRNGARAVEFYKAAFGAIEIFRVEDGAGAVVCRLSVEGAEFWVADESPEHANFSPESLGGGSVRMILTVPDPDATFAKAGRSRRERCGPGEGRLRLAAGSRGRSVRSSLGDWPSAAVLAGDRF